MANREDSPTALSARGSLRGIALALSIFGGALTVGAQSPPEERSEPDVPRQNLEELLRRVAALEGEREHASADWLARWHFHLIAVQVVQWATGADPVTGSDHDETRSTTSADIEIARPFDDGAGEVYLSFEAGLGDGIDDVLTFGTPSNADAIGDTDLQVLEAWARYAVVEDRLFVSGGRLDLTVSFDANHYANDERHQFLSGTFVNAATFAAPDPGVGVEVCGHFGGFVEWTTAIADPGVGDDPFHQPFLVSQLTAHFDESPIPTHVRLYAFQGADTPTVLDPSRTERSTGWGLSADAAIDPHLGVFLRYGEQDPEVAAIERAWSVGVAAGGHAWGRKRDTLGLAFASHAFGAETRSLTAGSSAHERVVELYYTARISDAVELTPDLQVIENPEGRGGASTVTIFGIRLGLIF